MSVHLDRAIDRAIEMCARLMLALMKYRRGRGHAEVFTALDDVDIAVGNLNLSLLHQVVPDDTITK